MSPSEKRSLNIPTLQDAGQILEKVTGQHALEVKRFSTGLAHYVYDVKTTEGENLVVRLARPDLSDFFQGAIYWYQKLKPMGIPLPNLIYGEPSPDVYGFPVMIMERLQGKDLAEVYPDLNSDQKKTLAGQIVTIQQKVHALPQGKGYGYAKGYDQKELFNSWPDFLYSQLYTSKERILAAKVVNPSIIDQVRQLIQSNIYFESVKPIPFLDDTTTKNVLIDQGQLTGIVDVDFICFGDPLRTPALTKMSLIGLGYETDYIDYWLESLKLTPEQRQAFNVYTAMYCVGFMSEIGQQFNKEELVQVDQQYIEKLQETLNKLVH